MPALTPTRPTTRSSEAIRRFADLPRTLPDAAGGSSISLVNPTRTRIKYPRHRPPRGRRRRGRSRRGRNRVGVPSPSTRYISLDRARESSAALPAFVTPVRLFVNADPTFVRDIANTLGLRHVQLNGDESPGLVALAPLVVIKALRVERDAFGQTLGKWRDGVVSHRLTNLKGVVLETAGTGPRRARAWRTTGKTVRRHSRAETSPASPDIAAGGLTRRRSLRWYA